MIQDKQVSFIISTFNRREILLHTLNRLRDCGLALEAFDIHIVDNASSDGTAEAIGAIDRLPQVHLHRLAENCGACAKNVALPHTTGEFVVFLDDDSFPLPGTIEQMIRHFDEWPRLGAATFNVKLPDGSAECSAYPDVFIGCGVGLRRAALVDVGGLPDDFFMQAEEYDLSLRLLDAGWDVKRFDDLHVMHLKSPLARSSPRTMRLDVRNNLVLIARYFPRDWAMPFALDWLRRYWMIASKKGQRLAFLRGMTQGCVRALRAGRKPISDAVFEQFARIEQIEQGMRAARRQHKLRSIILVDLGKNVLPYWLAAKACRLRIIGIADDRLAGRHYRGIPILTDERAQGLPFDAAIIGNSSPVHATARREGWKRFEVRPVIDLLEAQESKGGTRRSLAA